MFIVNRLKQYCTILCIVIYYVCCVYYLKIYLHYKNFTFILIPFLENNVGSCAFY